MGRKSTVGGLPTDILEQLHTLLLDPRVTLDETSEIINAVITAQSSGSAWPEQAIADIRQCMDSAGVTQTVAARCIGLILEWVTGKARKVKEVSRSAVGRYSIDYVQEFEEIAKELRESEHLTDLVMAELKLSNQSDAAQVTRELLQFMIMRLIPLVKRIMQGGELDVKEMKTLVSMIKDMTQSQQQLEQSATINEKRRREIEREAAKNLVDKAENLPGDQPLTADRLRQLLKETYGG